MSVCPYCGLSVPLSKKALEELAESSIADQNNQDLLTMTQNTLLRTVIDEAPDIILLKDWDGRFLLCNRALATLYGSTPEKMVGKSDIDFNPNTEQVEFYQENIRAVMRSGKTQIVEEKSTDSKTGEVHYFQSIKKPLKGPDGSDRVLVIAHDITELKRAHQAVEESEKRYAYAMEVAGEGLWDWDIRKNEVNHNPKWSELLGLETSRQTSDIDVFKSFVHPEDFPSVMQRIQNALNGEEEYSHEHRMIRADGREIWVHDRGRVVECDDTGRPVRMVGSFSDISAHKKAEQGLAESALKLKQTNDQLEQLVSERTLELALANRELQALLKKDPLTGVGNRLRLDDWIDSTDIDHAKVVLLMIDIDYFKDINDQYGHIAGDQVLTAVADCLKDAVSPKDMVARIGGEEFLLALTETDMIEASNFAESLRARIHALDLLPDRKPVTISIGVSRVAGDDYDKAMARADKALYQAKNDGRNQVKTFE